MWLVIIHLIKHHKNRFRVLITLYGVADVFVYMIQYSERITFIDDYDKVLHILSIKPLTTIHSYGFNNTIELC